MLKDVLHVQIIKIVPFVIPPIILFLMVPTVFVNLDFITVLEAVLLVLLAARHVHQERFVKLVLVDLLQLVLVVVALIMNF